VYNLEKRYDSKDNDSDDDREANSEAGGNNSWQEKMKKIDLDIAGHLKKLQKNTFS